MILNNIILLCFYLWLCICMTGMCVCVFYSYFSSCHPSILFCWAYFSILAISAHAATKPCAQTHLHLPKPLSDRVTQALLGRDIHTDTCATGALGNGKKIPVILPEFHRYCKDIRHRCSPLCVYSYVIIWSYVCLYMVNDRFHRGRQRRKNVFICILLR